MSNNQLFIPSQIKAGFKIRKDTYTGKLAYVIGHDGKKWRKEPSWEGWRHKGDREINVWNEKTKKWEDVFIKKEEVKPLEMQNIPTSGFVLNRKVGGDRGGWNPRRTYCRVYDPRGFEFEITIPNLLFILQESNSIKGKALEGEFVYSWDGKDLVLLPRRSTEYKNSVEYTDLQSEKVTKKDMIPGCNYLDNKQVNLMYIGYYLYFDEWSNFATSEGEIEYTPRKKHIFYNQKTNKFEIKSSYSQIKKRLTDSPNSDFANILDEFLNKTEFSSKAVDIVFLPVVNVGHYYIYINGVKYISSKQEDGTYALCITNFYRQFENIVMTLEEIREKCTYRYRVYENGFKKII